jgi:hypothetical protein
VQAENLLVEIGVTNGWLHDHFVFISPQGPKTPMLRMTPYIPMPNIRSMLPQRVGRHEFEYKEAPNCGPTIAVTCGDFRHGQKYVFEGIVGLDARAAETTEVSVAVTASNFRGTADRIEAIERTIERLHVSKLIDLNALKTTAPIPMQDTDNESIDWYALDDE